MIGIVSIIYIIILILGCCFALPICTGLDDKVEDDSESSELEMNDYQITNADG